MSGLGRWWAGLRRVSAPAAGAPLCLSFDRQPSRIYAIGDVHGCLDLLLSLEAQILAEPADAAGEERWIVVLGDFIDRGPSSSAVIDHLMRPDPPGHRRIVLKGNHEAMMLDFFASPRSRSGWLEQGGRETLMSYGVPLAALSRPQGNRAVERLVESHVPEEHAEFLRSLPCLVETPLHLFAHAGLRPGVPVEKQREADLLWYRDGFAESFASFGKMVVHGHQMREAPLVSGNRLGIDTGAYLTGRLSAACLTADGGVRIIQAHSSPRQAKLGEAPEPLL